ncbi:MAG: hypothetical protein [Olavius algarvensis Gamma 1 endosymbiont]|nr:MAG: hypothetical protein [Olavius algarvensis Gamma 1 endosymbiont]
MIEWATGRICAIFDEIFALTFSAGMYFILFSYDSFVEESRVVR